MQYFCHALKLNLKSRHSASASNYSMNRSARTEDDYQFSTAKNPLFNSTHICKVGDHWQEHRWAVQKGLPGLFPSRKRVMSVKGTECSELCGVMYVKPSDLISHAGRIRD